MPQSKSVTAYLRAKDAGFTSTFSKASSALRKVSGESKGTTGGIKSIVSALGIAKVAGMGFNTVVGSVSSALGRADTMEAYSRTITQLTGNSDAAGQSLDELKGITKGTAYGLDVAAKATQNFVTRGMDLGQATKSVGAWADAVAFYGKGTNEELATVTDALAKMRTKGKVEMDQLNRLFDVGIDAVGMYATATNQSSNDVQDALSKGSISTQDFLSVVEEGMLTGANGIRNIAGAAKDAGASWSGSIANMKSAITRGTLAMIEKFDELSKTVTGSSIREWISVTGTLFEDNLKKIADGVGKMVIFAMPYVDKFKSAFEKIKQPVVNAFNAVKESLQVLYSEFDKTASINNFGSIMDAVAGKIAEFANYVRDNSDKIADLIAMLPKLLSAFSALKAVSSVTEIVAGFGADVTETIGKVVETASELDAKLGSSLMNAANTGISAFSGFFQAFQQGLGTFVNGAGTFVLKNREIFNATKVLHSTGQFNLFESLTKSIMAFVPESRNFLSHANMMERKLVSMTSSIRHPIASLKNLSSSVTDAGGVLPFFGNGVKSMANAVAGGFKSMASVGIGAVKSLGAALLSNPITAILVAITAAIASVALAWKSNFMNIQGAVKSFVDVVKNSFTSMTGMFKGNEKVFSSLANLVKGAVSTAFKFLATTVALVVDGIRGLVLVVSTALNVLKTLGTVAMSVGKALKLAMKFDFKGAKKELSNVKKEVSDTLSDIGDNFNNFTENSATANLGKSFGELGKETKKAGEDIKGVVLELDGLNAAFDETSSKANETAQALSAVFEVNGENANWSEANAEYYKNNENQLKTHLETMQKARETYSQNVEKANSKDGKKQLIALQKANSDLMAEIGNSNQGTLAMYREYGEQLRTNRDSQGGELVEDERNRLQEQYNAIQASLLEEAQLYTAAAQNKVANQGTLNEQELTQLQSHLTEAGSIRAESIQTNNQKIQELEAQRDAATQESQRIAFQTEIDQLTQHNAQQQQMYTEQGIFLMQELQKQGQLNAETVLGSLQNMNTITDEQLALLFQEFVNSGQSIDQQMFLLGGMLQQRGFEGSRQLAQALQSHDLSAIAGQMTGEMEAGLIALPVAMFNGGENGKTQFINALKNGDYEGAGKFLVDKSTAGMESKAPDATKAGEKTGKSGAEGTKKTGNEHTNAGKENVSKQIKGMESKESEVRRTGEKIGKSGADGAKKTGPQYKEAGTSGGNQFVQGVIAKNSSSSSAGTGLANAAKSGAGSVSMTSVGSDMAEGVASGIRSKTGSAVSAMQSLVAQVNAEAKKKAEIKSPSRLLKREVGFQLPAGVAVGIKEKTKLAVIEARNMIASIQEAATSSPLGEGVLSGGDSRVQVDGSFDFFSSAIVDKLDEMIDTIVNHKMAVYMNTGELVGATGPAYNTNLGDQTRKEERYRL